MGTKDILREENLTPQVKHITMRLYVYVCVCVSLSISVCMSVYVFVRVYSINGNPIKCTIHRTLKTLFNIVAERLKKLLNFDVCIV